MNCALINTRPLAARSRQAFTLVEILIALAISAAFLLGVYAAYNQITRAHDEANVRLEALRNGRAALDTLSVEFKSASARGSDFLLVGLSQTLPTGDGYDNDRDGTVDEEIVNGLNDDTNNAEVADRHALLGNLRERPLFTDEPDLGDAGIDEDARFGRDIAIFRLPPDTPSPGILFKTVTYAVTDFDGQQNVLVRETRLERSGAEPLVGRAPLAFDVLGFDLLYYNPNALNPQDMGWVENWDSSEQGSFPPPRLPLPASVYIRITLRADTRPPTVTPAGRAVQTVILETMVNIEEMLDQIPRPTL